MKRQQYAAIFLVFLWFFAIGHCLADCLHSHNEKTHDHSHSQHHHHHGDSSDTNHNGDHTQCEISSVLPVNNLQKELYPVFAFSIIQKFSVFFAQASFAEKTEVIFHNWDNQALSYVSIAVKTLIISNAPPSIS